MKVSFWLAWALVCILWSGVEFQLDLPMGCFPSVNVFMYDRSMHVVHHFVQLQAGWYFNLQLGHLNGMTYRFCDRSTDVNANRPIVPFSLRDFPLDSPGGCLALPRIGVWHLGGIRARLVHSYLKFDNCMLRA